MNLPLSTLEPPAGTADAAESFVVFRLEETAYAVAARDVQEILSLPALTPIDQAPAYIAGILNLRGRVLPVLDLGRRLGRPARRPRIDDSVIVLDWRGTCAGIVVNEVCEVREIPRSAVVARPDFGRDASRGRSFLSGVAKTERGLIMLLSLEHLLQLPEEFDPPAPGDDGGQRPEPALAEAWVAATEAEKNVLRERAERCLAPLEQEDLGGLMPLAIVGLDDEYFGIDLGLVREFTELREVTPVPCCPPHIVGQMNLRGDILTVVDLRRVLNLAAVSARKLEQVMIVQVDDVLTGVAIQRVHDVVHLNPSQVRSLPLATQARGEEFLRGAASTGSLTCGLLDLPRILQKGGLEVNHDG